MKPIRYRKDLYQLLEMPGDAAEIGVAEGFFSRDLLDSPKIDRLYMVDRWKQVLDQKGDASNSQEWHDRNYADAKARVARFGDRAIFLRGDSVKMADHVPDRSLALLYIDGDHSFDGVLKDLMAWVPKVRIGGVVALHDYENDNYGVKKAVHHFCSIRDYTINLLPENKLEDGGAWFYVEPV